MDKGTFKSECQRILDNPAYGMIIRGMEATIVNQMLALKADDASQRLALVERLRAVRNFTAELERATRDFSETADDPTVA